MKQIRPLVLAVLLVMATVPAAAETAAQVFQKTSPSTVVVLTYDTAGQPTELGSGVVLPNGSVATNCHVLKDGTQYRVRYQGKDYPAQLRYSDWNRDVCSLTVSGLHAPPVVLGSTKTLQVGARVYAIGAPEGLQLTLSDGIVSSLRPVEGGSYIQITAAISHGSSGGGLFDDQGRLLGLTSFYVSEGQQLNFALPVEWIEALPQHSSQRVAGVTSEVDWINRAAALETKKDWQGLTALADGWTKASPHSGIAWIAFGEAHLNTDDYAQAIDAFLEALYINHEDAIAWESLGYAYYGARKRKNAIDAFLEALRINPQFAQGWEALGVAYDNAGQHEQAIEAFRQALRINPQDAAAWSGLGVAYGKAAENTQAIDAFHEALRINPQDAAAWSYLGVAYSEAAKYMQAIDAFHQALRINPQYAKAWYCLGLAYVLAGQKEQAIEAYQHLKTLSPELASKLFDSIVPQ